MCIVVCITCVCACSYLSTSFVLFVCMIVCMPYIRMDNASASICVLWVWCVHAETRPVRACWCWDASLGGSMCLNTIQSSVCVHYFHIQHAWKVFSMFEFHKTSKFDIYLRPIRCSAVKTSVCASFVLVLCMLKNSFVLILGMLKKGFYVLIHWY